MFLIATSLYAMHRQSKLSRKACHQGLPINHRTQWDLGLVIMDGVDAHEMDTEKSQGEIIGSGT